MESLDSQTIILLTSLAIVSIIFIPSFLVFAYVHFKSQRMSTSDPATYGIISTLGIFVIGISLAIIEPPFLTQLPSILIPVLAVCVTGLANYFSVTTAARALIPLLQAQKLSKKALDMRLPN